MFSDNQQNSIDEVEALKILNAGYVPEIQESEFVNHWLPLLASNKSRKEVIGRWIAEVAKSAQQKVRILRGSLEVGIVPPILAQWPTEQVASAKDSISELTATSAAMAAQIPMSGVTNLKRGLQVQYERTARSPVLEQAAKEHREAWNALFKAYNVTSTVDLGGDVVEEEAVSVGELLVDEEL